MPSGKFHCCLVMLFIDKLDADASVRACYCILLLYHYTAEKLSFHNGDFCLPELPGLHNQIMSIEHLNFIVEALPIGTLCLEL